MYALFVTKGQLHYRTQSNTTNRFWTLQHFPHIGPKAREAFNISTITPFTHTWRHWGLNIQPLQQPPHVDPRARWEFNRSPTSALRAHGAAALFWTNNLLSISSSKPQSTWRVQHQPYVITNTLYNWCSNTRPPKTKKTSLGFNYIRKPFHLVELHQNPLFKEPHLDSITPKLGKTYS